jgi:hypothetical protein
MITNPTHTGRSSAQRLLGVLAVLISALGMAKFLGLMAVYGPARSPWGFLLVLVAPFVVGRLLLTSHARIAATVIGVFAAPLAALCVVGAVQGVQPYWGDYLVVFVGGPLAVAAVGVAVRVLRGR